MDKTHPKQANRVHDLFREEKRLRREGDQDGALRVLDQIIGVDPNCAEAYNNKAALLLGKGQVKLALTLLEHALTLQPENGRAHNNLGYCYYVLGRYEDALKELDTAIANDYVHEGVYHHMGMALLRMGRCGEGVERLIKALRINPMYSPVLKDLSMIAAAFGWETPASSIADAERIKKLLVDIGSPRIF